MTTNEKQNKQPEAGKKELTPRQIQMRKKMVVFPLFFLAFAGCMWLIFSPGEKEREEPSAGFNTELPTPESEGILSDKRDAYVQEEMRRREREKMRSLQDFAFGMEDEEEEAAPTSEKRLKREIRAEALKRLEEAARTESDFLTVVDEWNKLDRNRERRERDHENLRGDVPLEFQAVPDPKIAPLWMNLPRFRQLCQGNFLDIIFSCPYELHELTANRFLSKLFFTLSDEQKEVLYYLFVKQYSTTRLAAIRGQSDRNIRKLRMTIQKKLQRRMYEHLSEKLERDYSITLREREFVEEYEALLQTMGKDAVIRRENKTKPRKKKAALDDDKDG